MWSGPCPSLTSPARSLLARGDERAVRSVAPSELSSPLVGRVRAAQVQPREPETAGRHHAGGIRTDSSPRPPLERRLVGRAMCAQPRRLIPRCVAAATLPCAGGHTNCRSWRTVGLGQSHPTLPCAGSHTNCGYRRTVRLRRGRRPSASRYPLPPSRMPWPYPPTRPHRAPDEHRPYPTKPRPVPNETTPRPQKPPPRPTRAGRSARDVVRPRTAPRARPIRRAGRPCRSRSPGRA